MMRISPLEIEQQTFNKALRGYDPVEVTTFLETLAGEFENLIAENAELQEKVKELSVKLDSYRQMEKTLQDTLVTSQRTAEEARRNVQREADLMIRQAQVEGKNILEQARAQLADLNRKIADLQMSKERYVAEFKAFLGAQWHLLENIESGAGPAKSHRPSGVRRARPQGEELEKILESLEKVDPQPDAGSGAQS